MWVDENRKAPVVDFLGWLLFITVFGQIIIFILEPASVNYAETGKITFAYIVYAIIGILFTTPAPAISLFILLRWEEHITVKEYLKRFIYTPKNILFF